MCPGFFELVFRFLLRKKREKRVSYPSPSAQIVDSIGGLNLEIKCPCARKTWHEREVGVFLKWAYFHETGICVLVCGVCMCVCV